MPVDNSGNWQKDQETVDYQNAVNRADGTVDQYGNRASSSSSSGDFMSSAVDGLYGGLKAANDARAAANRAAAVQAAAEQAQRDAEAEQHHDRGVQLGKNGNYDAAIAEFNQALNISEFAITYCERGVCFHAKGNYEQAVADYTAAFRDIPENIINTLSPRIHLNRGNAYTSLNRWTKAADDWNNAAWYKKSEEGKQAKKLLLEYKDTIEAQRIAELKEFLADEKAAKSGDANGMYNLGYDYYNGIGVKENHSKTRKWWTKAAKLGHKEAQEALKNVTLPAPMNKAAVIGAVVGAIIIGIFPSFGFFRLILGAIVGGIAGGVISAYSKGGTLDVIRFIICAAIGAAVFGLIPGYGVFRLIVGAAIGMVAGAAINDGEYPFLMAGACVGALAFGTIRTCMSQHNSVLINLVNIGGVMFIGAIAGLILGYILGKIFENKVLLVIFIAAVLVGGFVFGRSHIKSGVSSLLSKEKTAASKKNAVTVTSDSLNMRARAYGDAEIVKTLKKGDKLNVTGVEINGWIPVEHKGDHGYVSEEYVSGGNSKQSAERQTQSANAPSTPSTQKTQPQTQTAQPAAPAPETPVRSAVSTTPAPSIPQANQSASSDIDAREYRGRNNQEFQFLIIGTNGGRVWGSGTYTDDSNIAMAAVHAGKLKVGETGWVTIRILPGQSSYSGSTANGVETNEYGEYEGSFVFP